MSDFIRFLWHRYEHWIRNEPARVYYGWTRVGNRTLTHRECLRCGFFITSEG